MKDFFQPKSKKKDDSAPSKILTNLMAQLSKIDEEEKKEEIEDLPLPERQRSLSQNQAPAIP